MDRTSNSSLKEDNERLREVLKGLVDHGGNRLGRAFWAHKARKLLKETTP